MADSANVDTTNMCVFSGCFCCNTLCSSDVGSFLGCSGVSEFLCIQEEFCCKLNTTLMPCVCGPAEGVCCKIGLPCCACALKMPSLCCKSKSQCCCVTSNAALPCDEDAPCMLATLFIMCIPTCGVCVKMGDIKK